MEPGYSEDGSFGRQGLEADFPDDCDGALSISDADREGASLHFVMRDHTFTRCIQENVAVESRYLP